MPAWGVAVTDAQDPRTYAQILADMQALQLPKSQDQWRNTPETTFDEAAAATKELRCLSFLGVTRDMRTFDIGFRMDVKETDLHSWIRPTMAGSPIEREKQTVKYEYSVGRAPSCKNTVRRRCEEGYLPIVNAVYTDEGVDYHMQLFCSMEKTPLTKEKIQHHLTYSLWKYILLILVAVFGWNIVFSVTEHRAPEEKKVVAGVYAYGDHTLLATYMETVRLEYMSDMEELTCEFVMPDEAYGAMILSTRVAAREFDIYVLPRAEFQNYAAQGAFMSLDVVLPDLIAELEAAGVSLSRGSRTNDELGEKHQYAIPTAAMPELQDLLMVDVSDMYLCVFFETENNDNVLKFFEQLVRDMLKLPEAVPAQ